MQPSNDAPISDHAIVMIAFVPLVVIFLAGTGIGAALAYFILRCGAP